jgi:hypothetical protein
VSKHIAAALAGLTVLIGGADAATSTVNTCSPAAKQDEQPMRFGARRAD